MPPRLQPQGGGHKRVVHPTFWEDDELIAAGPVVMTIALYLITSPQGMATGLYRLRTQDVVDHTRIKPELVTKALDRLETLGFVERDGLLVWVVRMARFQIGEDLVGGDTRIIGAVESVLRHRKSHLAGRWLAYYAERWDGLRKFLDGEGRLFDRGGKKRREISDSARALMPHPMGHTMPHQMPHAMPHPMGHRMPGRKKEKNPYGVGSPSDSAGSCSPTASAGAERPPAEDLEPATENRTPTQEGEVPAPSVAAEAPDADVTASEGSSRGEATPGTAERFLGRLRERERETEPPDGQAVRYLRDQRGRVRGATLHAGPGRRSPGPWVMPPEVEDAIRSRLLDPVPGYRREPPPRLPKSDEELTAAMLVAWKAVHRKHDGREYKGRVGTRRENSVAEAGRMLRAEGLSAWAFFDWAWSYEQARTRRPPKFYTVASPTFVGRMLDRAKPLLTKRPSIVIDTESRVDLLRRREVASLDLRRSRPEDAKTATEIVDRHLSTTEYDDFIAGIRRECVAAKRRDLVAIRRGVWIWPG
jgi:hypothetical protein